MRSNSIEIKTTDVSSISLNLELGGLSVQGKLESLAQKRPLVASDTRWNTDSLIGITHDRNAGSSVEEQGHALTTINSEEPEGINTINLNEGGIPGAKPHSASSAAVQLLGEQDTAPLGTVVPPVVPMNGAFNVHKTSGQTPKANNSHERQNLVQQTLDRGPGDAPRDETSNLRTAIDPQHHKRESRLRDLTAMIDAKVSQVKELESPHSRSDPR